MSLLDFIKNRNRQQQTAEQETQSQPETAREMYTRQAAQATGQQKSVAEMPEADKAEARELGARLDKVQGLHQDARSHPASPSDAASNSEPMRQNLVAQDTAAPALSPTTELAGIHTVERSAELKPVDTPKRQQTMARTTPSWER